MKFAFLAPMVLGLSAGAIDFAAYNQQKSAMQAAADAAAIAAVREASLVNWTEKQATEIASAVVDAQYSSSGVGNKLHKVSAVPDAETRKIKVVVEQDHYPYFAASLFPSPQIKVEATAVEAATTNLCVLGLDDARSGTISLDSNAKLTATKCSVYSNSNHSKGISSLSNSIVSANLICSSGGIEGGGGNFKGERVTNCPAYSDPLIGRPAPTIGSCTFSNKVVKDRTVTLSPGVYCGGLTIDGNADVRLNAGTYIIKDGPFIVDSNAKVYGRQVGFYFSGEKSVFRFTSNAEIDLEAPKTGPLSGILFFEDRASDEDRRFEIQSNFANNLVGTIYLSKGILAVDADNAVADKSAYTAIIVKGMELRSGPNLVLNTDYNATDVPVPAGVGSKEGSIRLVD